MLKRGGKGLVIIVFHLKFHCNEKRSMSSSLTLLMTDFLTIARDVVSISLLMLTRTTQPIERAIQVREGGHLRNGSAAGPEDTVIPVLHPKETEEIKKWQ